MEVPAAQSMNAALAAYLERRRRGTQGLSPPLVLALAHGTLPVAVEVAKVLKADLDVVEAREIRVHGHSGAVGAVTADGPSFFHQQALARLGRREEDFAESVEAQRCMARKLLRGYHSERRAQPIAGRTVILVDDGRASEVVVIAALRRVRNSFPGCLVFASPATVHAEAARKEADTVILGTVPSHVPASPATEQEVRDLLLKAARLARQNTQGTVPNVTTAGQIARSWIRETRP